MQTGNTNYIYKNDLDKACFQYDMAHGELRDKAFNIAKNPKYDGYQRGVASMVYKLYDKTIFLVEQLNSCQNTKLRMIFINPLL